MNDSADNHVRLTGHVTGAPAERVLPSGDVLVTFRITVPRVERGVDTFECAAWTPAMRELALGLSLRETVTVEGALRRRFQRGTAGPSSFYSVEVETCRAKAALH